MINKKTLITGQLLIAVMMAGLMSGYMSFLHAGPTIAWFSEWARAFMFAFPVAFPLSLVVSPLAFRIARALT